MKNQQYKLKGIIKIIKASDRDLLEFIATQLLYQCAKSTDDWEIAYDSMVVTKEVDDTKDKD